MKRYLAVYGTLRSDCPTHLGMRGRSLIQERATRVGLFPLKGTMISLGGFPGVIQKEKSNEDHFLAEIWMFTDEKKWNDTIAYLNSYEGASYRLSTINCPAILGGGPDHSSSDVHYYEYLGSYSSTGIYCWIDHMCALGGADVR